MTTIGDCRGQSSMGDAIVSNNDNRQWKWHLIRISAGHGAGAGGSSSVVADLLCLSAWSLKGRNIRGDPQFVNKGIGRKIVEKRNGLIRKDSERTIHNIAWVLRLREGNNLGLPALDGISDLLGFCRFRSSLNDQSRNDKDDHGWLLLVFRVYEVYGNYFPLARLNLTTVGTVSDRLILTESRSMARQELIFSSKIRKALEHRRMYTSSESSCRSAAAV